MRISKLAGLDNYLISGLIHVIVFLLLSFYTVQQSDKVRELVLELFTPEHPEVVREDFTRVGSSSNAANPTNTAEGSVLNSSTSGAPYTDKLTPEPKVGSSIEPPVARPNSRLNSSPVSGTSSGYLSGVKTQLGAGGTGSSGFQMEDDGGNISVLKSVIPSPQISDYGTVKLQFKINRDGTVNSESVIPVIIDDPIYNIASIEAIKQWRFSVKNYSGTKAYRITFIFKPEIK
jgi:TonB family protein